MYLLVTIDILRPNAVNTIVVIGRMDSADIVVHESIITVVDEFCNDSASGVVLVDCIFARKDGEYCSMPVIFHGRVSILAGRNVDSGMFSVAGGRNCKHTELA